MNFRDLCGMYRIAIMRCVDMIAQDLPLETDEEGKHPNVESIFQVIDGEILLLNGNLPILFEDPGNLLGIIPEQRLTLQKYHMILCSMSELDEKMAKYESDNDTD